MCYDCDKPAIQCICGSISPVHNRTQVTVLQHPRERRHPLGTARLLRLGLRRVHVEVCWDLQPSAATRSTMRPPYGVLYPHPGAQPLVSLPPSERPEHLIVLDGTWSHARAMHRANPWLHQLPHYSITPDGIDRYRIRREPQSHCTSTVEAVVHALQLLEPETPGFNHLLASFTTMIDRQIACIGVAPNIVRRRARPRLLRRAILDTWHRENARLWVIYGEFTLKRQASGAVRRELIHFVAYHLASGQLLQHVVAPPTLSPQAEHLLHMGLQEADLAAAIDLPSLRAAWQACHVGKPPPRVLAWNKMTLDLFAEHVDSASPTDLIKGVYCNVTRKNPCGHLDAVAQAHNLAPWRISCRGRAAERLGHAVSVTKWLLNMPHHPAP